MKRRITIKDIAQQAGVSAALVSMALNARFGPDGKPNCRVKKETILRIRDIAESLGYIPNNAAAQISSGKSRSIAVITSDISNAFFAEISKHIENMAYESGYNVFFASSDENSEKMKNVVYNLLRVGVDGFIMVPSSTDPAVLSQLRNLRMPVVFLERDIPDYAEAGRIVLDNEQTCRIAVRELFDAGCRHIEQITYDLNISTILQKNAGYYKAMEELGLSSVAKISSVRHGANVAEMVEIVREAARRGVDGLFLPTNTITVRTLQAMKILGLKVPDDIAIVGFDSCDLFYLNDPTITYIYQSTVDLAQMSFRMLLDMIQDNSGPSTILLEPQLVRGGSTSRSF